MQIRYDTGLTFEQYREQEAWRFIKLDHCPLHPEGGCGFCRHATYPRKFPDYCEIARFFCPMAGVTIGLLPDFFCSRFPGTLDEVEQAVNIAGSCGSQEEAAEELRPEITLPSALRWLRRRLKYVKDTLAIVAGLLLLDCSPCLEDFRSRLGVNCVLVNLRYMARDFLGSLPPVVGFGPRSGKRYCP